MPKVIPRGQYFQTERKLARKEPVSREQNSDALDFLEQRPFVAAVLICISRVLERPGTLCRKFLRLS